MPGPQKKPGKLTVRPQALADLREAALYLNGQRPYLGRRLLSSVHQTLRELLLMPRSGSLKFYPGSRPELRQWPVKGWANYLIFYRILENDDILVVRVLHSSRDIQTILSEEDS